ncbi:MAG: hypothetical protein JWM02_879 [Frankiales bacterium]|nr:hypothetical protein [Frankiales bacterium]
MELVTPFAGAVLPLPTAGTWNPASAPLAVIPMGGCLGCSTGLAVPWQNTSFTTAPVAGVSELPRLDLRTS